MATKVGTWFTTSKRDQYCLAKSLERITNVLAPNQLMQNPLNLPFVLAWQNFV
jgi:hypothetical protein